MGNGAKAQQKRDRAGADVKKGPTSQLKSNLASQTIKCSVCMQTFQQTAKAPMLTEHATNKHNKDLATCFPMFTGA